MNDADGMRPATGTAGEDERPDDAADAREGDELDWRGWVLVGVVVLCFLVLPAIVVLRPPELPFVVAFLALPLVPAVLLAIVAVWTAVRSA